MHGLPELTPTEIAERADWPDTTTAHVRANMVMTLDGSVIGTTGTSRTISSPEDHELLLLLRRDCHAILIGASTARTEGYRRPQVPLALISRSLHGLLDVPALVADHENGRPRPIVITTRSSDAGLRAAVAEFADVEMVGEDSVDLAQAIAVLAERGLTRIHCEGGPHVLAQMMDLGLIDELYCAITPRLLGADEALHLVPGLQHAPRQLTLRSAYRSAGTVFLRYDAKRRD